MMMQSLRQATKNTMFDKWLGAIKKDGGGSIKTNPAAAPIPTTPANASPEAGTSKCLAEDPVATACGSTHLLSVAVVESGTVTVDGTAHATTSLGLSHGPEAMRRPLNEVAVYLAGACIRI